MGLSGNLVIEGMRYTRQDKKLPVLDPMTGEPTGETTERICLLHQALDSGVIVEIRIAPDDFPAYLAEIQKTPVTLATAADLKKLVNGNGS